MNHQFELPASYKKWTYGLIGAGLVALVWGFIMYHPFEHAGHGEHAAAELQQLRFDGADGAQDGRQHGQVVPRVGEELVGDGVQHVGICFGDLLVAQHDQHHDHHDDEEQDQVHHRPEGATGRRRRAGAVAARATALHHEAALRAMYHHVVVSAAVHVGQEVDRKSVV
mgnify:CR=1 FL=1